MAALHKLPQEILDLILLQVSPQCFRSLARVCRRLHSLCNPLLYRLVCLRDPKRGEQFINTITTSPHLVPHIRGLQFHYHGTCEDDPDPDDEVYDYFEDIVPAISHLHNIESLVVRTDYFGEPNIDVFLQPHFLPALRYCNLGFDKSPTDRWHWSMRYWEALFHHPGIRTMVITGAHPQILPHKIPSPRSTPLEELHLLNCEISAISVSHLLQYPRALKCFVLKGQAFDDPNYKIVVRDNDRSLYVNALKEHAHSLEYLDLDLYDDHPEPVDLHDFGALKTLITTPRNISGDYDNLAMEYYPWKTTTWDQQLPPSLEILTFRDELRACDTEMLRETGGFPLQIIYEKVCSGELSRLSQFSCEIREILADERLHPLEFPPSPEEVMATKVKRSDMSFTQAFVALGIRFSATWVPQAFVLPENEVFPCDCWVYRHRPYSSSALSKIW